MLGIAHHSPHTIMVYLDRLRFRELLVKEADVRDNTDAIETFDAEPSDGRQKVLFVETVAALRLLQRRRYQAPGLKIAVYDTADELATVPCRVLDEPVNGVARLTIDEFNDALETATPGLPGAPEPAEESKPRDAFPALPPPPALPASEPSPEPSPEPAPRRRRKKEPDSYRLF